jgi:hypothetical protein
VYRSHLLNSIYGPWLSMKPILAGRVPPGVPTADAYVLVEQEDRPCARIDAYFKHSGPFTELVDWGRWVVLGCDSTVFLIDPLARETREIGCDGYFGHLYSSDNLLLVATASELICLDERGVQLWKQSGLAIDGVVVDQIEQGVVLGQGEWDPPGGWRAFRVSLKTGQRVAD